MLHPCKAIKEELAGFHLKITSCIVLITVTLLLTVLWLHALILLDTAPVWLHLLFSPGLLCSAVLCTYLH